MLSQTGKYALNAVIFLARRGEGNYCLAREIGGELGIPAQYLSKVLHQMARKGLLESQRGKQGGFRLKVSPGQLSLFDVLDAVEDTSRFQSCLLGSGQCSDQAPCPMHKQWQIIRDWYFELLNSTMISYLADEQHGKRTSYKQL
ncbi:RrF2 family transcriptional regulator [Gemmatimonadota bacterium]